MASSSGEVAVFTDTNLGTRIAMDVSPDITAGDFKRLKGAWVLHVEAKPLFEVDGTGLSPCIDAKARDHNVNVNDAAYSLFASTEKNGIINNGKRPRINGSYGTTPLSKVLSRTVSHSSGKRKKKKRVESAAEGKCSPIVEIPMERASSNYSEMSKLGSPSGGNATSITVQHHLQKQVKAKRNATCTNIQIDDFSRLTVKTPLRTWSFPLSTHSRLGTSKNEPVTEVGKGLVKASKKISNSACKTSPSISFCRFKNGKLLHNRASSLAQYLVFEISDDDD